MRSIEVSTDVFARIWANRMDGEESENAILARLLGLASQSTSGVLNEKFEYRAGHERVLWRDDVKQALVKLGGRAHLRSIYKEVRSIRLESGRSVPTNLEAIVRRELEYNSSSSNVFKGRHDWFMSVDGIGSGIWAIRDRNES